MYVCFFFFFKQKTAYEMRISDWSSDVCSSDLQHDLVRDQPLIPPIARLLERPRADPARVDDRLHSGGGRRAAALPAAHAAVAVGEAEQRGNRARQHFLDEGRQLDAAHVLYLREHRKRHDRVDRKSTRLNSSHKCASRMPSSA